MTEVIATEDDNVMSHFCQVWVIRMEDLRWMLSLVIQMDECRVIKRDILKLPKHPLIHLKYAWMILKITRRSCKYLVVEIFRREMITCMWQSLQPHHCTVWQWRFYQIRKTCKKWDMTLSSWMAMNSVMHDRPWCKNGTNGKSMSCSLLICHVQIFELIDIRTMGHWKWIFYILIRAVYVCTWPCKSTTEVSQEINVKVKQE